MKSILSAILTCVLLLFPLTAVAHMPVTGNGGFCQNAQTTADLVQCSSAHLQSETNRLNSIYTSFIDKVQDDALKQSVSDNQAVWLSYYKTACENEAKIYEGGSLARVQLLTCQSRLMSERVWHFEVLLNSLDPDYIPVYANPPRWMNVLGAEYNDIFWSLSSKKSVDTDCDGVKEVALHGIQAQGDDGYKMIWAIADSQRTGRPVIKIIKFDDTRNCRIIPNIELTILPEPKPSDTKTDGPSCNEKLSLATENCGQFFIQYDAETQSYTLQQ